MIINLFLPKKPYKHLPPQFNRNYKYPDTHWASCGPGINQQMNRSFIHQVIGLVSDLKKLLVQQGTFTMATKYISPGLESTAPKATQSKTAWEIKEGERAPQKALQREPV